MRRPARAGDVPRHGGQTLEGATFVLKLAGGRHRDLVFPLAPFAQQHRARREIELTRFCSLFDLGMLRANGLQPLAGGYREAAEGIVDFTFNLGAGRLQTSTLRRRINQMDWSSASQELQRWVYGGGKVLPGLVTRRRAEAALMR